jgi:hypothetical protein
MKERRRLEGMVAAFTGHVAASKPSELCLNQWDQCIQGGGVTRAPRPQQIRHLP